MKITNKELILRIRFLVVRINTEQTLPEPDQRICYSSKDSCNTHPLLKLQPLPHLHHHLTQSPTVTRILRASAKQLLKMKWPCLDKALHEGKEGKAARINFLIRWPSHPPPKPSLLADRALLQASVSPSLFERNSPSVEARLCLFSTSCLSVLLQKSNTNAVGRAFIPSVSMYSCGWI